MTEASRPSPSRAFLAVLGVAMVAGAAAGLVDAATSPPSAAGPAAGAFWAAAFGALLGLAAFLPVAIVLAALPFPRSPAGAPAVAAVLILAAPAGLAAGRHLYHRLPWGAGDAALAAGAALGLVVLGALAAAAAARLPSERGTAIARGLVSAFVPALLLAVPAGGRLVAATRAAPASGEAAGANLLLVTVDTLRPDALGCTGSPFARTPWLDRIARGAALFSDCVAPSPWTLPSLGTVLTGRYPGEHRVLEALSDVSPDVVTIAEAAQRNGRRTAAFVSNPWLAAGGLERGFDTFDVAERLESLEMIRSTRLCAAVTKTALRLRRLDSAEQVTARGLEWIARGEGRWFLWLHLFDPHLPNQPPAPWDRLFGPPPVHTHFGMEVEEIRAGRFSGGDEGRREIERLYHAEVAYTDHAVGGVWRALEGAGELARTAIVFSADHGEELWDHAGYGHGHAMHDEVVRVPWLVRPPGGGEGRVDGSLAALADLAPTALAAAEMPFPAGAFRGRSRIGPEAPARAATYGEATLYGDEQKFLRTPEWLLVLRVTEADAAAATPAPPAPGDVQLFHRTRDPGERTDLSAREPAVRDSLLAVLRQWRAEVGSAGAMAARDLPDDIDAATRAQLEALGYLP